MTIQEQADYLAKMACIVEDNIGRLEKCALDPSTLATIGGLGGAGLGAIVNTVLANRRAKKYKTPVGSNVSHALLGALTGGAAGAGLGYIGGAMSNDQPLLTKTPAEKIQEAKSKLTSAIDSNYSDYSQILRFGENPVTALQTLAELGIKEIPTGQWLPKLVGGVLPGVGDLGTGTIGRLALGGASTVGLSNIYARHMAGKQLEKLTKAIDNKTTEEYVGKPGENGDAWYKRWPRAVFGKGDYPRNVDILAIKERETPLADIFAKLRGDMSRAPAPAATNPPLTLPDYDKMDLKKYPAAYLDKARLDAIREAYPELYRRGSQSAPPRTDADVVRLLTSGRRNAQNVLAKLEGNKVNYVDALKRHRMAEYNKHRWFGAKALTGLQLAPAVINALRPYTPNLPAE